MLLPPLLLPDHPRLLTLLLPPSWGATAMIPQLLLPHGCLPTQLLPLLSSARMRTLARKAARQYLLRVNQGTGQG